MSLVWMALIGCASLEMLTSSGDVVPIYVEDTTLPVATVAVSYDEAIPVRGGLRPYFWRKSIGKLPAGLRLTDDGRIVGRAAESGHFTVTVDATDASGAVKFARITIPVERDPLTVGCGDTVGGHFDGSGWGSDGHIDLSRFNTYAWLDLQQPPPDVTRVEIIPTTASGMEIYLGIPTEPAGSIDLEDGYVRMPVSPDEPLVIDLGTDPSLTHYEDQAMIPLIIASNGAREWGLEVVCSKGPVFDRLWQLPVELGLEIEIDYDILGSQEGIRFWTDDPLPPWVRLEEDGRMVGIAEEIGGWDFVIQAEDTFGRVRAEDTMLGVFDVQDVKCGERELLDTTEGMYDGLFTGAYDPRGFDVFRVRFDRGVSEVTLFLDGHDDTYVGVARPDPYFRFWANAAWEYDFGGPSQLVLGTRSFPRWSNYASDGQVLVIAAPFYGTSDTLGLTVSCDERPRTDMPGLPVLLPNTTELEPLVGIGGAPPYLWSADDAPAGLALGQELRTLGMPEGVSTIDLTITDDVAQQDTDLYRLIVGDDTACETAEPLPCDVEISGSFEVSYWQESELTERSTRTWCIVPRGLEALHVELELMKDTEATLSFGDPGLDLQQVLYEDTPVLRTFGEEGEIIQLNLALEGWPSLGDYYKLPIFLTAQSYEPGEWLLRTSCF